MKRVGMYLINLARGPLMWRWVAVPVLGIFGHELGWVFGNAIGYVVPFEGPLSLWMLYPFVLGGLMVGCAALPAAVVAPVARPPIAAIVSAGAIAWSFVGWPPHPGPTAFAGLAGGLVAGVVVTVAVLGRFHRWWLWSVHAFERRAGIQQWGWYREVERSPGTPVLLIAGGAILLAVLLFGGAQLVDFLIAVTHTDPDTVDWGFRLKMFFWISMGGSMVVLGLSAWGVSLVSLSIVALHHRRLLATRVGSVCLALNAILLLDYCFTPLRVLLRWLSTAGLVPR